jgi:hypothetical protein
VTNLLYFLPLIITTFICITIYLGKYSPLLISWWLTSIILLILFSLVGRKTKIEFPKLYLAKKHVFILLVILLPSLVRITNYNLNRIHGDDMLTAYFSATENFSKVNFFSGIPSDKIQWQSQFPTPFFALQKIFFMIFGESMLTIKLSMIPYILIISIMLFLITKKILGTKDAYFAVILYAFFAISLYYETLGLIFTSSTAIFMLFFYFMLRELKNNDLLSAVFSGISCGFCYLFYMTSYIALPIMVIFFTLQLLQVRKLSVIKNFLFASISFLIVLGPFLTYAYKFDNYFTSRTNQVSLLTGTWSGAKDRIAKGESPLVPLKENAINSFRSFYIPGIGGAGGFDFAHQAVFDSFTLLIVISGCVIGVLYMIIKIEFSFVFIVIIASYMTIVLAVPPPGYHRFTLAFPFLALLSSLPFYVVLSLTKRVKFIGYIIIAFSLFIYGYNNQQYFLKS